MFFLEGTLKIINCLYQLLLRLVGNGAEVTYRSTAPNVGSMVLSKLCGWMKSWVLPTTSVAL